MQPLLSTFLAHLLALSHIDFSHVDCFQMQTVFICLYKLFIYGLFSVVDCFTCGLLINCLHTLTTNWLFTKLDSMTVYTSRQHVDYLHNWTACWLFTQVESMLTVYTSGHMFVYTSGQYMDYLHNWKAYWVCKSRQHVYCFLKFDHVDCVQITMWDLNTGQLLRTVTDWRCGLCSDHHVGPEHRPAAEDCHWLTLWTVFRSPCGTWTQANCWGPSLMPTRLAPPFFM